MFEFFNWTDTGYVASSNWIWLLITLLIGIYIGWRTCDTSSDNRN